MSGFIDAIRQLMSVPHEDRDLLQAQYRAFSKQIPLLYFILLVSTWGLAHSFRLTAPGWLTFDLPLALTFVCGIRLLSWGRSIGETPSHEVAAKALRRTNRLAGLLAAAFSAWAMVLFQYGDAYAQAHVAFYMAITVIGCIFCLMHLRPAALIVALVFNIAFVVFFSTSGRPTFVATAINALLVSGAMLAILTVNYRDFTRMIAAQASTQALSNQNFRLANLDPLTELPNRRKFFAELDQKFAEAAPRNAWLAVGVLDLDGFKPVNDLHGHLVGDTLLTQVGARLKQVGGEAVLIARLGGDEFALLAADMDDDALTALSERLCAAMREPFMVDETVIRISASVGIAVYPGLAGSAMELFEQADYALYHSKRTHRGETSLFSFDHAAAIYRDARIERTLHGADLERELSVFFQPIVDLNTERPVAFEALARWDSPELGQVPPGHFIPVAERAGLISRLTRLLLEKALAVASTWPSDIRLSFNLSTRDIDTPEGVMRLVALVSGSGFPANRLDFEITETAMMNDFGQARAAIDTLKALGCGISLDDFGTGYSSLSQLHSLPLTKIKIDRSFVTHIDRRPASHKIVKSLLALSRDMGLGCIVEGVETDAELAVLRGLGCRFVQGYRFSVPLTEGAVTAMMNGRYRPRLAASA